MSVGSACSSAGSCAGITNPRLRRKSRDMALSVADVYDLAADIGKLSLLPFYYIVFVTKMHIILMKSEKSVM